MNVILLLGGAVKAIDLFLQVKGIMLFSLYEKTVTVLSGKGLNGCS